MLRIFRNLRKTTLKKGKVTKYVMYALGEIVLVVIGILVALYINGIYDSNKRHELEQATLIDLKEEFSSNLELALEGQSDLRKKLRSKVQLLSILDKKALDSIPEKQLFGLLFEAFAYNFNVEMETGKLDALIYSGDIKRITDSDLKNKLAGWNSGTTLFKDQINSIAVKRDEANGLIIKNGNYRQILQYFDPYHDTISFDSVEPGFAESMTVMKSAEFENRLLQLFTMFMTFNYELMPGYIERLKEVLAMIDGELDA